MVLMDLFYMLFWIYIFSWIYLAIHFNKEETIIIDNLQKVTDLVIVLLLGPLFATVFFFE